MAFADPQSVTPTGGSAISLPRTSSSIGAGAFTSADGNTTLLVSSQYGTRTRRTARLNMQKIADNPYNDGLNSLFSMSAYLVVDIPVLGYSLADQEANVGALTAWLTASSSAKVAQLLGGEN